MHYIVSAVIFVKKLRQSKGGSIEMPKKQPKSRGHFLKIKASSGHPFFKMKANPGRKPPLLPAAGPGATGFFFQKNYKYFLISLRDSKMQVGFTSDSATVCISASPVKTRNPFAPLFTPHATSV